MRIQIVVKRGQKVVAEILSDEIKDARCLKISDYERLVQAEAVLNELCDGLRFHIMEHV